MICNLWMALNVALLSLVGLVSPGCDSPSGVIEPVASPRMASIPSVPQTYYPVDVEKSLNVRYDPVPQQEFKIIPNGGIPGQNDADIQIETATYGATSFYVGYWYFPTAFSVNYVYDDDQITGFKVTNVVWAATNDLNTYYNLPCGLAITNSSTSQATNTIFSSLYYDYVGLVLAYGYELISTPTLSSRTRSILAGTYGVAVISSTYAMDYEPEFLDLYDNAINLALAPYFWRIIVASTHSAVYTDGYEAGYEKGHNDGKREGEIIGYNNAVDDNQGTFISNLFGSVIGIPMKVLSGLSVFTVFNVPIVSILITLLFASFILWVIKRLLK